MTQIQPKRRVFAFRRPVRRAFLTSLGKTFVILPSAFLAALAVGLVSFGMIFFMRDVYNAPVGLIGWFSALWTLSYFAGCIFLRPLLTGLLPRYSMILATTLMGIWILCILLIRSLVLSFLFYGLFGVSLSLFFPRLMGWLSQRMNDRTLNRVMARFNLSWSTATIISPVLGGLLFERNSLLPIVASMGIFFALTLLIGAASIFLPRIRGDNHADDKPGSGDDGIDRSTPLRYPAWIGLITTYALMGILGSVFHGAAGTHERAKRMAIHEALITAGAFSGASVGGTLLQSYSMNAVFLFSLGLVISGALLQILFMLWIRKHQRACTE